MSASEGDVRPIIIVKKKVHGGHGHHGGAWKVAYADLVTAMMALFMVLWLIGQSPKTRSTVGAYFRDPLGLAGGGNNEINTGPQSGGAGFFEGGNTALSIELAISNGNIARRNDAAEREELMQLSQARDRLAQALMSLRAHSWARHVELTATEEGLRIEVQDRGEVSLFVGGTARINPEAHEVLDAIAQELGLLPNRVVIEGHTDATPAARGSSNWELSSNRANAARSYLTQSGLRRDQVAEVRGYADQRPRLWHDPTNERNRRVSILVLLERGRSQRPEPSPPPTAHPLLERLEDLDYAAQGPEGPIELSPGGTRLPRTPSGGPSASVVPNEPAPLGAGATEPDGH